MPFHGCPTSPCPVCTRQSQVPSPVWIINRPCGHSYAQHCGCNYPGRATTTTWFELPTEYVGKHRRKE